MRIQRLIPCVSNEGPRKRRQVDVAVLLQNELRYQKVRERGVIEVVADLQSIILFATNQPLHLEGCIAQAGGKKRVFTGALDEEAGEGTPLRADKMGLQVRRQKSLIEPREQQRCTGCLAEPPHISTAELQKTPRTRIGRLAWSNLI